MLVRDLPYTHDSAKLFALLVGEKWAMLLDSGQAINPATGKPASQYGHYDIIVAEPFATLVTHNGGTQITHLDAHYSTRENPFDALKTLLAQYPAPPSGHLFAGGALGFWGYDLNRDAANLAPRTQDLPQMMVGLYDWAILIDHRAKTCKLVSHGFLPQTRANLDALQARFSAPAGDIALKPFSVHAAPQANFTRAQYHAAIDKIHAYIRAGDCYQVNLAQRFSAPVAGDAWTAYVKLREISPAPFMAFMQFGDFQVLSNSPERFLQSDGTHVETRPIKGTRPRSADPAQDLANANALQASIKDRAENVMIVDLLRNDISKVCEIGSVRADTLFQLQSFANVHHLVSIVTGKLKAGQHAVDLLAACFPGGSITGAPKLRAMQIIDELEPDARGIYCGAIGYIGFDGKIDTNIAIRTAVVAQNQITFYAGGGVVIDSSAESEYQETLNKAQSMSRLLSIFMQICYNE